MNFANVIKNGYNREAGDSSTTFWFRIESLLVLSKRKWMIHIDVYQVR